MEIKPIKTKHDYEISLSRIAELMSKSLNSDEDAELEILAILIERYESKNFNIPLPDPIEALKFRRDQLNKSNSLFLPYIGSSGRVSEVMNKKRKLTLPMIRKLHDGLGISYEVLIQDYELTK